MSYWLFQIMYDRYPETWGLMVEKGIAVEHYPLKEEWTNAKRNNKELEKLHKGDFIVASFKDHRFAGYGKLTSNFYIGVESLSITDQRWGPEYEAGFYERFNCDWTVIPLDRDLVFIDCSDLAVPVPGKKMIKDIDLLRGCCVKEIEKPVFDKLKARLDKNGAVRVMPSTTH
jgi:hypothetical protein